MSTSTTVPGTPGAGPASAGPSHQTGPALAWAGFLTFLLTRALRSVLLTLLVVASIPLVSSWSGYVVRSGSMEPGLSAGDVVVAQPLPSGEPIPVGRVMVFENPDVTSAHTTMIHRVVEKLDTGEFATAGDANRENDSTPAATDDFRARPTLVVPYVGLPLTWLASRDLGPLILWLVAVSVALYFSVRPPCDPPHRRRRDASRARRAGLRAGRSLNRVPVMAVPALGLLVAGVAAPLTHADAAFTSSTGTRASWAVSTTLAKTLAMGDVVDLVRGTVPLTATLTEASGRAFAVRIEYAPAGTTTWKTVCTDSTSPYSCSWVTSGVANGDYDLRAVATSGATVYTSDLVEDVSVDNLAPVTTMQDPGSPLRGTVTTSATATDAHSGIDSVVIQYALSGTSTFKDICTTDEAPYSCRFDTTAVAGGTYSFRSIATDAAGNVTTSATVTNRVIDNSVATVSVEDPGAYLTGTVPVTATANASAGITSVRIQRAPAGTTTWTDICTDTAAPFTCSWATTGATDGMYDLRAVMLDKAAKTTTSATVSNRRVDNSPLRGADVQTANGGATAGRLERGDTMTLTYSQQASLSSISAGWTGSPLAVTVRLRDGYLLGLGTNDDTITVLRSGATVNLGSINLKQSYIKSLRSADFAATMTASTTTVNGVTATRVTLTMGSQTSGSTLPTVSTPSVMVWTPSAAATNPAGRAASTTPTPETGASDREF